MAIRLSKKEAQKILGKKAIQDDNKYNAQKSYIDGMKFDSMKEAETYLDLKQEKKENKIKDFIVKPGPITLQPAFKDKYGKKHRKITYSPDFLIYHHDGKQVYVDTKGKRTRDYSMRKKMLLNKFPNIEFEER